jgi:hypothetical protein
MPLRSIFLRYVHGQKQFDPLGTNYTHHESCHWNLCLRATSILKYWCVRWRYCFKVFIYLWLGELTFLTLVIKWYCIAHGFCNFPYKSTWTYCQSKFFKSMNYFSSLSRYRKEKILRTRCLISYRFWIQLTCGSLYYSPERTPSLYTWH